MHFVKIFEKCMFEIKIFVTFYFPYDDHYPDFFDFVKQLSFRYIDICQDAEYVV